MKLIATSTELAVLRACTHRKPEISGMALSMVDESYFCNKHTRKAYRRVLKMSSSDGHTPSWQDVLDDTNLNEGVRQKLKDAKIEKIASTQELKKSVSTLNRYRQLRGLYQMTEDVVTALNEKEVDPDDLISKAAEELVRLRRNKSDSHTIVQFGKGNNATSLVKKLLTDSEKNFLPTGFATFDSRNGGFGWGNLVVIGGTTGGGKSTTAAQLAINWADMGEDVTLVPLEMSEMEMTARLMANAASLDVRKILFNKLSEQEKVKYWKSYKKFIKNKKDEEGTLRIWKPDYDVSIEEILASVYPLGSRIVIIDYISLLKGADGDDAWQKLGAIARYCKIYAEAHNMIIVLLCQLSEEGKIRYARAIAEHANYAWTFIATQETQENEILNVNQLKARNGERFDFTLKALMSYMQVRDLEADEKDSLKPPKVSREGKDFKGKGKNGKGKGKDSKQERVNAPKDYLKDLSDDEDDED